MDMHGDTTEFFITVSQASLDFLQNNYFACK